MDNFLINSAEETVNYTWRREWIHLFESPWGIVERFKYANNVTSTDVLKILGTEGTNNKTLSQKSKPDLITLQGLDPRKMISAFGVCLKKHNALFMRQFILPFNRLGLKYFLNTTVFCNDCLDIGYHSLFHQFALLRKCPFHLTPLIYGCPNCGRRIPYEINIRLFNYPFTCQCGAAFFKESTNLPFFQTWTLTKNLRLQNPEIRHWITFDDGHLDQLKKFYILPGKLLAGKPIATESAVNLISRDLTLIPDEVYPALTMFSFKIIKIKPELPPSNYISNLRGLVNGSFMGSLRERCQINELILEKYFDFETYRYSCLLQLYKAIARRLKKRMLKAHKQCLRTYFSNPLNQCVYSYAYIRWRQEMESLDDPSKVENCKPILRLPISSIPNNFCDNKVMNYVSFTAIENFLEFDTSIVSTRELWPTAISIFGRLFAHFAMRRYHEWLDHAMSLSDTSIESSLAIPKLEITEPLIILEKDSLRRDTLRLYISNNQTPSQNPI